MKLLAFTPDRASAFSFVGDALRTEAFVNPDGSTRPAALTSVERRTLGKLLDRLDVVSLEQGARRALVKAGADVVIEDSEHALLLKMFELTPWRPGLSREANAAEDFLKAAPEYVP